MAISTVSSEQMNSLKKTGYGLFFQNCQARIGLWLLTEASTVTIRQLRHYPLQY